MSRSRVPDTPSPMYPSRGALSIVICHICFITPATVYPTYPFFSGNSMFSHAIISLRFPIKIPICA